jgi:hypothetical protein
MVPDTASQLKMADVVALKGKHTPTAYSDTEPGGVAMETGQVGLPYCDAATAGTGGV